MLGRVDQVTRIGASIGAGHGGLLRWAAVRVFDDLEGQGGGIDDREIAVHRATASAPALAAGISPQGLASAESRRPAEQAKRPCHLLAQPGLATDDNRGIEEFAVRIDEDRKSTRLNQSRPHLV